MKKGLYHLGILLLVLLFNACEKGMAPPEISQPQVFKNAEKNTIVSGDVTITTGPLKGYEQGSDVVYQLKVTSVLPLTKFTVATNTDVFSMISHVIKTEPENVIDASGNFIPGVKEVVIYYSLRIDDSIIPLTNMNVSFSLQNESNYVGMTDDNFKVIKKGSTNGQPLFFQTLDYLRPDQNGIGTQETFDFIHGTRAENNTRAQYKRGPFYSLELNRDLGTMLADVLYSPTKFDFVGYLPRIKGTNPALNSNDFYLLSPSDTAVLTGSYVGARQGGLSLLGSSGTGQIKFMGSTFPITYVTNTTTTATNFANANKAFYATKGITLTSTGANLYWVTAVKGVNANQAEFTNLTGTLQANPYYVGPESGNTFRKIIDMRNGIRQMVLALKPGEKFKTTYYKRLDNVTGSNKLTAADFDLLTHDNEFDKLLTGIVEEKNTVAGPLDFDQVYGFVTSDGKRGLIRTLPRSYLKNGVIAANNAIASTDYALFCTIKYQQL